LGAYERKGVARYSGWTVPRPPLPITKRAPVQAALVGIGAQYIEEVIFQGGMQTGKGREVGERITKGFGMVLGSGGWKAERFRCKGVGVKGGEKVRLEEKWVAAT